MTVPVPLVLRSADGVLLAAAYWPPVGSAAYRPTSESPSEPAANCPSAADGGIGCVVAHGFTGSGRSPDVQRICRTFADRGFGVLVADFRGHGRSGGTGTAGVEEIHDVAAGTAWLRDHGFARVVTLGWSMGATAVLRHAGLGGDTDAVVSVSAPGTWWERGTRPMQIVHWMVGTRTGRVTTRLLRRTRVSAAPWSDPPEAPADLVHRIPPRPLLLVHGDADHYFPVHHVENLAAAAPQAQVWIEPGMRHAENATTADLLARIGDWVVGAVGVCHDGACD